MFSGKGEKKPIEKVLAERYLYYGAAGLGNHVLSSERHVIRVSREKEVAFITVAH